MPKGQTNARIGKKKLTPIPCDCKRCINRGRTGCRFGLEGKIKDGKCLRFGTYATNGYTLTRAERAAIIAHNKSVDKVRAAEKAESKNPPVVKLAQLRQLCSSNFTMDYLRKFKGRFRPGNARYEIECINDYPLTIKLKGWKGARKTYIIEE